MGNGFHMVQEQCLLTPSLEGEVRPVVALPGTVMQYVMEFIPAALGLGALANASGTSWRLVQDLVSCRVRAQGWSDTPSEQAQHIPSLLRLAILEALSPTLGKRNLDLMLSKLARCREQRESTWCGVFPRSPCPVAFVPLAARWPLLAGNELALQLHDYLHFQKGCPAKEARWIRNDLHKMRTASSALWLNDGLQSLLMALTAVPEIGGYVGGMNSVVATVYHALGCDQFLAFLTLANFFHHTKMFSWRQGRSPLECRLQVFEEALARSHPDLGDAFTSRHLIPAMYAGAPLALGFLPDAPATLDDVGRTNAWHALWEELFSVRCPRELDSMLATIALKRVVAVRSHLFALWLEQRPDEFEATLALLRRAMAVSEA